MLEFWSVSICSTSSWCYLLSVTSSILFFGVSYFGVESSKITSSSILTISFVFLLLAFLIGIYYDNLFICLFSYYSKLNWFFYRFRVLLNIIQIYIWKITNRRLINIIFAMIFYLYKKIANHFLLFVKDILFFARKALNFSIKSKELSKYQNFSFVKYTVSIYP